MYEAYKPFRDLSCTVCLKIDSITSTTSTRTPSQSVTRPPDDGKLNVCILYSLI